MISRHVDRGLYPSSFMYSDQWVKCPKCSHLSILKYDSPLSSVNAPYQGTFSFSCLNCCYQIKAEESSISSRHNGHFYATAYQRCQSCGGSWLKANQKMNNSGAYPPYIQAKCHLCQKFSKFEKYNVAFVLDQKFGFTHYGLELYLKTSSRHGDIYVYNPTHLKELKIFIDANLRERTKQTGNSSYFSRLPAWIKSTRNRKEILKAILRLEQMASTIQPLTNK
ncbi:hypothetical protein [Acinetobacter seifertii]|uniref:hypothetical protein n=1 Tax=Acinetobacter seifertii TaxID=1530123 RepID=UPI000A3AE935|nr:hypothetical protein [Acinetobacter seifertii]